MGDACARGRQAGEPVRVLVTGASGFLGGAVARAVAEHGHRVTTLQRRPSGVQGASDVLGSVTDPASIDRALSGADAIIHLAAKVSLAGDPREFRQVNVDGTSMLLDRASAAGVRDVVFVSSPSVAHSGSSISGSDAEPADPAAARGEYARTKAIAERIALGADSDSLRIVAIRPHLVWGPGDTQLIERIVARARRGTLPLLDSGSALIDTTYVDNAASAMVAALGRLDHIHGEAYVVTNGEPRTVGDLMTGICLAAGVRPPRLAIPAGVARFAGSAIEKAWALRPGRDEPPMTRFLAEQLSTAHWFDQRRTRRDLDWIPGVTLDEGFARLAAHYGAASTQS